MSVIPISELLSAYLDGELSPEDHFRVEKMLAEDAGVREQLEGLCRVSLGVRQLERPAPPPALDLAQLHRLTRLDRHRGLIEYLQDFLPGIAGRHSSLIPAFALMLLFGWSIYSYSVWNWNHPPGDSAEISGKMFLREGEVWFQAGISNWLTPRPVDLASTEGQSFLESRPDLVGVAKLGEVVLETDDGLVRLIPADPFANG